MIHSDYITHIKNEEDIIYLKEKHFPVNIRLFKTSPEYKEIILQQCNYIRMLTLAKMDGYKKPHGMSSANAGLAFNIIAICRNRGKEGEFAQIMINPKIYHYSKKFENSLSNCGSLTLDKPIFIKRNKKVCVEWFNENGDRCIGFFYRKTGGFTIQHEIDHNNGILITDRKIQTNI